MVFISYTSGFGQFITTLGKPLMSFRHHLKDIVLISSGFDVIILFFDLDHRLILVMSEWLLEPIL